MGVAGKFSVFIVLHHLASQRLRAAGIMTIRGILMSGDHRGLQPVVFDLLPATDLLRPASSTEGSLDTGPSMRATNQPDMRMLSENVDQLEQTAFR